MARTFEDIYGERHNLDSLMDDFVVTLELDKDIVTGNIVGYGVLLDSERKFDINKAVYDSLRKILD